MIRSAKSEDIHEIRSLMNSVQGFWQNSWRSDVLESDLRSSDGLAFVHTEGNRIIGFVCAHDLGFRGYLSEIVVAETHQRRGIGKSLVNAVEKELTKRGCEILVADVWKDAEEFYIKLGWSPPDVILLRKKLL